MKTIEKENGQIFEVYTSRQEFAKLVKDLKSDTDYEGYIWTDDDSSLYLEYADGTTVYVINGDSTKQVKITNIIKGIWSNACSEAIYNCEIVYNEHYNDYDVAI